MPLAELEKFISGQLPPSIALLYAQPDVVGDEHGLMRVLTKAEAVETTEAIRSFYTEMHAGLLLLWTDDNSNYAGVFFRGELSPRVALLDHEEPESTPAFFGVESFQAARHLGAENGMGWYDLPTDYPVTSLVDHPLLEADRELSHRYLNAYLSKPEGDQHLAFYAMNLIPPSDTHCLTNLLNSDDMWVQERACRIIGQRGYEPAIDELERIALEGMHNGRIAAIIALKKIGTQEARLKLNALANKLDPDYSLYLQ